MNFNGSQQCGSYRVLILGDSITLGAAEVRGNDIIEFARPTFVELLQAEYLQGATNHPIHFTIDADTHRTTTASLERLEKTLEEQSPDAMLFMIGGNDADLDWRRFVLSDGAVVRHRVDVDKYAKNLHAVAARCETAGVDLVVGDVSSMSLAMRGPYLTKLSGRDVDGMLQRGGGQAESDRALSVYRAALKQAAIACGFLTALFTDDFITRPADTVLSIDGVHPNAAGHRLIADALVPQLQKLLLHQTTARSSEQSTKFRKRRSLV